MDRATADSNIRASGLNWYGKPHELLTRARDGKIELAVRCESGRISRILRDKLEWSDDRLKSMRAQVATFTKRVSSTETVDVVKADPTTTESSNAPSPPGL